LDRDYAASGLPGYFTDQPSPGAWMGILGYAFNQYVAVEVEAGIGGASSEFGTESATYGSIGVETPVGAYVVLSAPVGGGTYLYGKAGYVSATIEREYLNQNAPDLDLSGAAVGAGVGFRTGAWDFRMDYTFMSSSGGSGDGGVLGMAFLRRF